MEIMLWYHAIFPATSLNRKKPYRFYTLHTAPISYSGYPPSIKFYLRYGTMLFSLLQNF